MTHRHAMEAKTSLAILGLFAGLGVLPLSGVPRPARAAGPKRKGLRPYVVRPGDSCWSIAKKLFGDGRKYTIIHRYNNLGPLPHLLKPGQRLWVPGSAAGPLAHLTWLLHDVRSRAPRDTEWRRAHPNQGLWRLYRVATGSGSSARIRFVDRSSLRMRPEALLIIYGGASAHTRIKARPKTTVFLERGTLRGGLARLDRQASLEIRTPSSNVVLKSKSAQVAVDRLKTSMVSVYQGVASVLAQGARVVVPKNHGTWTRMGRRPAKPVPLPDPPQWDMPSEAPQVLAVLPGRWGAFEARWHAVPRAKKYHVELARDPRFTRIIVDAEVGAGVRKFLAKDLRMGRYWARVSTVDRHGLESRPGRAIQVRIVRLAVSRRLHRGPDGILETTGLLLIQPPALHETQPMKASLDQGPFRPWTKPLLLMTPGLHRIRYRQESGKDTKTIRVRILRVQARLTLSDKPQRIGSSALVTLRLTDERGRPAALPGLVLQTPTGPVAVKPTGPGRFSGQVVLPASWRGRFYPLRLAWVGGPLAHARISLQPVISPRPRPRTPKPRPARRQALPAWIWPMAPVDMGWAVTSPGYLGQAAKPVSSLGLVTYLADGPKRPSTTSRHLFLVSELWGSLGLLGNRIGLSAAFPWFAGPLDQDQQTGRQDMGDLRLALFGVAWSGSGLILSPVVGLTFPTRHSPPGQSLLRSEPGLRLDWTYRNIFTVGTNQVLSVAAWPHRKTSGTYASSYHLGWHPMKLLALSVEMDTWIGLFGPDDAKNLRALALSAGLWFNLGRARIALAGGAGLNRDARNTLGRFRMGVSAELGFPGI